MLRTKAIGATSERANEIQRMESMDIMSYIRILQNFCEPTQLQVMGCHRPVYHRVKTGSKRRMNKGTIAKNLKQVERRSREQGNRKTKKRNGCQSSINKTRSPDSGMRKRRMGSLDCPKIAP